MCIETELKFIVHPDAVSKITELLHQIDGHYSAPRQLTNTYYETADQWLRQHDMGLRIRGEEERYEMTLKTAGSVIAGLHKRPEYNVSLTAPKLDLAKFSAEVWPTNCDVGELQQRLNPLFCTDFQREKWVVSFPSGKVEVAFDRGEINANGHSLPLCEVELELQQGEVTALFQLVEQLAIVDGLRLGSESKAARGYGLLASSVREKRPLRVLQIASGSTVEQGILSAVTWALAHWQWHEELWLSGEKRAKAEIQRSLLLLRTLFSLVGGILPRRATAQERQFMLQLEETLQQEQLDAEQLCYRSDYLKTKLSLVKWLTLKEWQHQLTEKEQGKLQSTFKRFADVMLSRCSADLKHCFAQVINMTVYQDRSERLEKNILAFYILSGAYPALQREQYIAGWQTLQQVLASGEANKIEQCRQEALSQPLFWLHSGQQ